MPTRHDRLATYLNRPRAGQLLTACGLCIGLVLAAAVTWFITTSRQGVIDDAVREMRNDALLLADEQDRLLRSVDVVQLGLIEHMRALGVDSPETFERLATSRALHENLRDRIAGLSYVGELSLADRLGTLLNASRDWPAPSVNDADQDFIRALTVAGAPANFISLPSRGGTGGQWTIHLSRRFDATDGRLIGFVFSSIDTDSFERFYARLPLTGGGSFALYRRDGSLLARYPPVDPKRVARSTEPANFAHPPGSPDNGVVRLAGVFDASDRLLVSHAMTNFPLTIAVSDTMDSILRAWREESHILAAAAVLLELMIAGTMLLARGHLRGRARLQAAETARASAEAGLAVAEEREHAGQTLHTQELRFDMALQNMLQGLIMLDHAGTVLVVNRRFCELAGVAMEAITPGMSDVMLMRLSVAAGKFQSEDMINLRLRRAGMAGRSKGTTFIWECMDGRAFTVAHQPMAEGWLITYEDITERRAIEAKIAHLAHHDALTGLPNRVLFRETLERALAFARRGHLLALLCLDLDQFKAVNDTLGHPIGDSLLQAVARRLRDGLSEIDAVACLGGDEFAIVRTALESPVEATELADRLIEILETPFEIGGHQIAISTSIGIAFAPQDGLDADQLLKNADLAMYRAKADGRGVYRLFQTEMDAAMQARRVLEIDLRQALQAGQLELFYQPVIDVRTRRPSGCEALLRWRHPTMGLVSPDRFIPLAEKTGLIVPIGAWVLRQACAAAAGWSDGLKVAVNLSAVQFKSRDLVGSVAAALRDAGLPANRLELEITETVMLNDTDATLATLHELRELGIHIAMDDFGTGYSSLSYLRRFPFDRIKIDQSFIRELGKADDCIAIVRAVIALGRDLGMAITAEGVETRQQLDTLEQAGCSEIQGYLFSRPVPASAIADLLRALPGITEVWPPFGSRISSRPVETKEQRSALVG